MKPQESENTKKIGILGAAFDPPHFGHFLLAQTALATQEIDEIWLVPSPDRWDKKLIGPAEQRLSWLQAALKDCPAHLKQKLSVSDIELRLPAYRGTFWLLSQLRRTHPDTQFSLILGWDSFLSLPAWRDPTTNVINGDEILKTTRLYVSPRPVHPDAAQPHPANHPNGIVMLPALDDPSSGDVSWMGGITRSAVAALSSSLVRAALARGENIPFVFSKLQTEIEKSDVYTKS
ncbi:MAG: nicotinate-nicotinamide nucleotide adenylyltransferase [Proteobacteria bacterium]|nr:nicotinate-nicotinamide nucleotide adenylyltransferase [Pseudomonadota bacterium]